MNQILATAFHGLFWYLVLALVFVVLAAVLRSPRVEGWRGERGVQRPAQLPQVADPVEPVRASQPPG